MAFVGASDAPDHVVVDTSGNQQFDTSDVTLALKKISADHEAIALASEPFAVPLPSARVTKYYLRVGVERVTQWTLHGVETGWKGTVRSVGWASGVLNWNGRNVAVGVQDDNSNGHFDDPFRTNRQNMGDLMFFDWNGDGQYSGSREVLRGCRYLFADEQLCSISIATGGVHMALQQVTTGSGSLQCDASVREVHLVSPQGLLVAPVRHGAVELPRGPYELLLWIARKTATNGDDWELKTGNPSPPSVNIGARPVHINLLASIAPVLNVDRQDDALRFTLAIGTTSGDTLLRLAPLHEPAPAPQLRLFDAAGVPLARIRLTPAGQAAFGAFWRPPFDAPDMLRARLEFDHGPFGMVETPDWEFSVPRAPPASP